MIYFVRFRDAEPVKIGRSDEPKKRLSSLRSKFGVDLSIIRVIEGRRFAELWLHEHFVDRHIWGEWFRFCPEMMDIIPPDAPVSADEEWPKVVTITGNRFYDDRLFMEHRPSTGGGYFRGHALWAWVPDPSI